MKFILLATALMFTVTTTAFAADHFDVIGKGMSKGGSFISFVDRDSVENGKNGMIRFLIVNRFGKPQQSPKQKKQYDIALLEVIASCTNKTMMNPVVAYLTDKKTLVERVTTGDTKLSLPPARIKTMFTPAIDRACNIAQHPEQSGGKGKS